MMKFKDLFTRKQEPQQGSKGLPKWQEKLLAKQREYAAWMQRKSEKLSIGYKWALLCCFLLGSITLSGYLLIRAPDKGKAVVKISRIRTPVSLEQSRRQDFLPPSEYNRLRQFRMYMDSLARSPGGSDRFREFNTAHPGLLDSIRTLEQHYDIQFKTRKNGNETHR